MNLLPPDAPDKGDALRALIGETRCSNVLYVGDDDTDETVFGLHLPSVLTLRVEPAADSRRDAVPARSARGADADAAHRAAMSAGRCGRRAADCRTGRVT